MLREPCKGSRNKRICEEGMKILERERLKKTEKRRGIIVDAPLTPFITLWELLTSFSPSPDFAFLGIKISI